MAAPAPPPDAGPPPVEIGWLLVGPMRRRHAEAARRAAHAMAARLAALLPGFDWRITVLERDGPPAGPAAEPVLLLDAAGSVGDERHWDFALVVTDRPLVTHDRPSAMAMPARLLSAAVLSTAALAGPDDAAEALERRLLALTLHLFGRLNDLAPDTDCDRWMRTPGRPEDLDGIDGYDDAELARLRRRLAQVADLRVEEEGDPRARPVAFYLRSLWENRTELPQAVLRMRPWAFPLRLSRLTTAAGSTLVVLLLTAEAWELAAALGVGRLAALSLLTLAATSAYLLRAQRLLAHSRGPALRELRAVANVGTVLAVAAGMAVTWVAVFAVALAAGLLLFPPGLLAGWTGIGAPGLAIALKMAAFTAGLGIVVGALGASFEPHGYFRHVTHVDDEI